MQPRRNGTRAVQPSPQFEEEWSKLYEAFHSLLAFVSGAQKPDIRKNMEAYSVCYNLATRNEPTRSGISNQQIMYTRLKDMVEQYLARDVTQSVVHLKGEELLHATFKAWKDHQLVVRWSRFMFRYLDDYYTKQQNIDRLHVMMLKSFLSAVYERIKQDLCAVLLAQVERERNGYDIERGVVQEAINLISQMGIDTVKIYQNDFEKSFLLATAAFYKRLAAQWLSEDGGVFTYFKRAEDRLNQELQRALAILHTSSVSKTVESVEFELLENHQTRLLEDPDAGVAACLSGARLEDLGRMFRLFNKLGPTKGLPPMANLLRDFIKAEGKAINAKFSGGEYDTQQIVDQFLDLHDKYTDIFKNHMGNDNAFHKARKEAFEVFLNENLKVPKGDAVMTSSELLSSYCDNIMRNEKITEDERDTRTDAIVQLFTFVSDKDLFSEFYRKLMAKRLLVSKTDNEHEKAFISKLKMKMGAPYTSKLEGMIADKAVSGESGRKFDDWNRVNGVPLGVDFTAQVLTTGFWPAFKVDALNLPPELARCIQAFKTFYDRTTQSKVLKWCHHLGQAEVQGKNFKSDPNKKYFMTVTTYQACTLVMFNDKVSIPAADISRELSLPYEEVKRTLASLMFGKFPILAKEGGGKNINENDVFKVNEEFSSKMTKFKVAQIIKATTGEPQEKVDETRKHVIEAAIVRIMKTRKRMVHAELLSETIRQLSAVFKPDPRIIKKRIEDLMARQYLERDADDVNMYKYLA